MESSLGHTPEQELTNANAHVSRPWEVPAACA